MNSHTKVKRGDAKLGSELVIDESMGKWRPYIQVRMRYYRDCAL